MENIRNVAFIGSDVGKTISDILVNEDENGSEVGCYCDHASATMDILCEFCEAPYAHSRYIAKTGNLIGKKDERFR